MGDKIVALKDITSRAIMTLNLMGFWSMPFVLEQRG